MFVSEVSLIKPQINLLRIQRNKGSTEIMPIVMLIFVHDSLQSMSS